MENDGIFNGHLEYFTVIWYILRPFGNVVVIWYTHFPSFWYIVSRKIWQHCTLLKADPGSKSKVLPSKGLPKNGPTNLSKSKSDGHLIPLFFCDWNLCAG
jgi:hypothetical protein